MRKVSSRKNSPRNSLSEEEQPIYLDRASCRAPELVLLIIWQLQAGEIREEIRGAQMIVPQVPLLTIHRASPLLSVKRKFTAQ